MSGPSRPASLAVSKGVMRIWVLKGCVLAKEDLEKTVVLGGVFLCASSSEARLARYLPYLGWGRTEFYDNEFEADADNTCRVAVFKRSLQLNEFI